MGLRIGCLLLTVILLLPMMVGCGAGGKGYTGTEYQVVYDDADIYAYLGAKSLSNAAKRVLGNTVDVISSARFDPETHIKATIFVGDVGLVEDLPELGDKNFAVDHTKAGAVIRAKDQLTLYLACNAIAKSWVTEEYGLVGEGELAMNKKICQRLSELSVGSDTMISVMTQNVRCNGDGIGKTVDDRKVRLKQLVEDYSPDLLGTQEVTRKWAGILEEYFGHTYGMVGCSRDGETATTGEWNMILYKKERFDLVDSGTFWLTDTPDVPSKLDNIIYNRICTWAILLDKLTNTEVLFCNTHLDHKSDEARATEATYLMNFIKQYVGRYPVFLTGDFQVCQTVYTPDHGTAQKRYTTQSCGTAGQIFDLFQMCLSGHPAVFRVGIPDRLYKFDGR